MTATAGWHHGTASRSVTCRRGTSPVAMLAADKLLLRSTVKQKTIELREKELNLFNANFSAVAT